MATTDLLKSAQVAWRLSAVLLGGVIALAYALLGWIGIGFVGLAGLVITTNSMLYGGPTMADRDFESGDEPLYTRQFEDARKSPSSGEQKMAAAARQTNLSQVVYLFNTAFISMLALGFGFFVIREL